MKEDGEKYKQVAGVSPSSAMPPMLPDEVTLSYSLKKVREEESSKKVAMYVLRIATDKMRKMHGDSTSEVRERWGNEVEAHMVFSIGSDDTLLKVSNETAVFVAKLRSKRGNASACHHKNIPTNCCIVKDCEEESEEAPDKIVQLHKEHYEERMATFKSNLAKCFLGRGGVFVELAGKQEFASIEVPDVAVYSEQLQ